MRILLVEDEAKLARSLARGLQEEGHTVDCCERGLDAFEQAEATPYDMVVLDWMLPDMDGLAILRQWRARGLQVPVLMLTARGSVNERVLGLRAGADDYLVKPFAFDELLARMDALQRRSGLSQSVRQVGDVALDTRKRALVRDHREVALSAREYSLALQLFEQAGEVLTRTELLGRVWGNQFDGEPNVVDVYIGYLRKKLSETGTSSAQIRTVRGIGYRLEASAEAAA